MEFVVLQVDNIKEFARCDSTCVQKKTGNKKYMNELALSEPDKRGFQKAFDFCKLWCSEHQAELGIAEMALGVGILSWGVLNGHILMGHDVVASKLPGIGGLAGLGIGAAGSAAIATTFLKGCFVGGVTGIAGVTAIPAVALIGGGALILGAFGYVIGDAVNAIISPPMGFDALLLGGSIVAVGAALLIDGARRIVKDERVLQMTSKFNDGVIQFSSQATEIVATTWDELQGFTKELVKSPVASATAVSTAAAGAAIGGSLATGSVTVLGSHALGAAALSLGLVSAPIWPVIAGGAAGLALGVAAWKGVTHFRNKEGDTSAE